jgi:probable phosphoglycerate mutase
MSQALDGAVTNGARPVPDVGDAAADSATGPRSGTAPAPATLVLSRHGQSVWHAENRYAGSSDIDLTAVGHRQAQALADWAGEHRPDALYSSPVRRARESTAPVSAATGMTATIEQDLREVHFGVAEGLTIGEMRSRFPEAAARFEADPVAGSFPAAEPPEAAAARGTAALRRIAGAHPGATVLVVAHSTLIRLVLCSLLSIPLRNYRQSLPKLDNGTLTSIRLGGDQHSPCALLSYNVPLASLSPSGGTPQSVLVPQSG